MSDDRIQSDRSEFESQPAKRGNNEDSAGAGPIHNQLSRSQRHGNHAQPASSSKVMSAGKTPGRHSEAEEEEHEEYERPLWARIILWTIRKSIVPIIMIAMLIAGLYVGFVLLGKGSKEEVFDWNTWRHMYDLIFAES